MSTYETLQSKFPRATDDEIHEQAKVIRALFDSPEPVALVAKITEEQWTHKPSRRIFTVADVQGKLDKTNDYCERRSLEPEYKAHVGWTLPASFGKCLLDFIGKEGTQFTVYEFSK